MSSSLPYSAAMRIITLTTDFGLGDWFVGTMKGVMLSIAPTARIVDITHGIPPGEVRAAAFALMASYSFFPKGSVHVAVVDPGVGSTRHALAVRTRNYVFVGPDNGVLSLAAERDRIRQIVRIEGPGYILPHVSQTFHGRDVFAPAAAHLSKGLRLGFLGRPLNNYVRLEMPVPRVDKGIVRGEIVYVDNFGNAITNIGENDLAPFRGKSHRINVRRKVLPLVRFYQAVPRGRALGLIGSTGFLEIAVNGGHAAQQLKLRVGSQVIIRPRARC